MPIHINRKNLQQYSKLELLAKQTVEGFITGKHKSPYHGFSVEFAEHKQYNQGQSTKHIDWKLFGRTEKLYTKQYDEETNLRCQFILDTSSSMYYPEKKEFNKLNFSVQSIACLAYLLRQQRDAIGLTTFDQQINFHSNNKVNEKHQEFIFEELEKILNNSNKNKITNTINSFNELITRLKKRSLLIIFSDLLNQNIDSFWMKIQQLKHQNHEIIIFNTLDYSTELELNFDNKPFEFIDLETGEQLKINPSDYKKEYQKTMDHFLTLNKNKALENKISLINCDINQGLDFILNEFLHQRKRNL